MNRSTRIAVCWLAAALLVSWVSHSQERPFRLQGLRGGELRPADLDRGVVIALVWASWSPRSRDIVERANAIADRWGGQARVIMVNFQEDRADVEAFVAGKRSEVPNYIDEAGDFSKSYSVTHLPGLVILKDGATAFSGKLSGDPDSIITQAVG